MTIKPVIAGPILRRLTSNQITFWMVTSCPTPISIEINTLEGQALHQRLLDQTVAFAGTFFNNPMSLL